MAASSAEMDYYHLVKKHLESVKDAVNSYALNFVIWETLYTDRAETLVVLDRYLDESLDLITIQLGENAKILDTFESDFEYLLNHIQESAPQAEIIVIGDFWEYEGRDAIKEKVSEKCSVRYIPLSEIKDNKAYQCGLGTTVYSSEGKPHTVEHSGVAVHPNDKAMELIADKIIGCLGN